MNILYIGDIMGKPGRHVVSKLLPGIRIKYDVDFVIAQAENVTHGKAMSKKHFAELQESGVDAFSGGNHTFERKDTLQMVNNHKYPVIAPANVQRGNSTSYKIIKHGNETVAMVSLLGYTIPSGYDQYTTSPLDCMDSLLPEILANNPTAIIVNIHGDVSSEKVMTGHYLDGKVTAVVGDHWHVPTADQRVLANGTAHVSDVGMCGVLNSSLGVDINVAIARWKGSVARNAMADLKEQQFNAVLITKEATSTRATSIVRIQEFI